MQHMRLTEFHIRNGVIELHGIRNMGTLGVPIVFIPGLWGEAEQFREILERLYPRQAFAISLRGRGKSDVPENGYSLQDHVSDIKVLVDALDLSTFCLVSVSAGASYAIGYVAEEGQKLAKLVLTDYPALTKSYPPEMVQGVLSSIKNVRISKRFLIGLQRESVSRDLSDELKRISCSVTILRGAREGSYLNEDHINFYRQNVKNVTVQVLSEMAHDPLEATDCFVEGLAHSLVDRQEVFESENHLYKLASDLTNLHRN